MKLTLTFDGIVSTEDIEMFKQSPVVYNHYTQTSGSEPEDIWLISGNIFDVTGARSCGWKTAWVQRFMESIFDPLDEFEAATIKNLADLPAVFSDF